MNQFPISSKSLISLKNLFFELNALGIFESLKDSACATSLCSRRRAAMRGWAGASGGVYAICIWPRPKIRKIESVNQTPYLAAPTPP